MLLFVWQAVECLPIRLLATVVAVVLVAVCYLYPIYGYLHRSGEAPVSAADHPAKDGHGSSP